MKFEEIPLVIPKLEDLKKQYNELIGKLEGSSTAKEQIKQYRKVMKFNDYVSTIFTVISIRYSLDTTNEEYIKAQDVLDEIAPQIEVYNDKINKILINSPFRKELEKTFETN